MEKTYRILCVDDEDYNLDLFENLLTMPGYEVLTATDGAGALELLAARSVDLVLLDIKMPGMNGYEVCGKIKADPSLRHIPVIMVSSLDSRDSKLKSIEAGAEELLSKPLDKAELLLRVKNILGARDYADAFSYLIHALARTSEANDIDTGNHILRVGSYCALFARELGMPEKYIETIRLQSTLHDVGKIHIPSHILKKEGRLTDAEMEEVKKHSAFGAMIIGDHPRLVFGKRIALSHHEKWDGTGYPHGLKGEEIPLEARITAIADCYDALRNSRVYKPCYTHKEACEIITRGDVRVRPEHFDPRLLEIFKRIEPLMETLYISMKDAHAAC
ncbi:MAG: HD domain-containing phosphohydrolase [Elusimicrobiales bacterium]|jgi:putative two-component system response regulator